MRTIVMLTTFLTVYFTPAIIIAEHYHSGFGAGTWLFFGWTIASGVTIMVEDNVFQKEQEEYD